MRHPETSMIRVVHIREPNYELTLRRAAYIIAAATLLVGIAGGLLMAILDRHQYTTIWQGLWWSMQTITTVGYGDTVPKSTEGKVLAVLVMVTGIGLMSVVTAVITAVFIESARRKRGGSQHVAMEEIAERLARIEARLEELSEPKP
jgi:voltage-gated potassium channel